MMTSVVPPTTRPANRSEHAAHQRRRPHHLGQLAVAVPFPGGVRGRRSWHLCGASSATRRSTAADSGASAGGCARLRRAPRHAGCRWVSWSGAKGCGAPRPLRVPGCIRGADGYAGPLVRRFGQRQPFHAQLLQTLRTGDKADEYASVSAEWERGEMPPGPGEDDHGLHERAQPRRPRWPWRSSRCSPASAFGAGRGRWLGHLRHRDGQGIRSSSATVLEIDTICTEAEGYIAAAGIGSRVKTHPLNMFTQAWPQGFEAHFFSNIFHDWSEETCRLLARKSFEALPSRWPHPAARNPDGRRWLRAGWRAWRSRC